MVSVESVLGVDPASMVGCLTGFVGMLGFGDDFDHWRLLESAGQFEFVYVRRGWFGCKSWVE